MRFLTMVSAPTKVLCRLAVQPFSRFRTPLVGRKILLFSIVLNIFFNSMTLQFSRLSCPVPSFFLGALPAN